MTDNPCQAVQPDYAAFIAIDWADKEHAWSIQLPDSTRKKGTFKQTADDIDAFVQQWITQFDGRCLAVALEQSRGALTYALSKNPQLTLYPIHPSTSHAYRKAMLPSGAKSDPKDADLLLDLLVHHRERLRPLQPDTMETRKLQLMTEKRRQLVDQRTALTNQITDQLKLYFPLILEWFDKLERPVVAALLKRWPTLQDLQKEDPEQLRKFFHQHHSRYDDVIETRLDQLQKARPLTTDEAVIGTAVMTVETLLNMVGELSKGIDAFDKALDALAPQHPDYPIFKSFPRAGQVMTPRLMAAFGSRRERFASAREIQTYSGIAPVESASGSRCWVHFRWACPKFLRQTFHEYAELSIQGSDWARQYYKQKRAKGSEHDAAVRALAYKWLRILYRCWKDRKPYDEKIAAAGKGRTPPAPKPPKPPAACGKTKGARMKSIGEVLKSVIDQA